MLSESATLRPEGRESERKQGVIALVMDERAYLLCHLSADWATWAVPCGGSVVSVPDSAMV